MPCYTVQSNTVDVGAMSEALLALMVKRHGWLRDGNMIKVGGEWFTLDRQAGTIRGTGEAARLAVQVAGQIKQAYSGEVVRYAAARNGWQVKVTGSNRLQVIKG